MRFYQHVFGRVARGYQGGGEGFQVAALSPELSARPDMIDSLNRLSFFNFRGGTGEEVRYSFFRPANGYVALGCSRLARDRTGSQGCFAHHLVCTEAEFILHDFSPAALLRSFPFFASEADLPEDRTLPPVEPRIPAPELPSGQAWTRSLHLVDRVFMNGERLLPMGVLPESEMWPVLEGMFRILPRREGAQLSFSTLFTAASDFAPWFILVFVPSENLIPSSSSLFRVIRPRDMEQRPQWTSPLTELWSSHPECGPPLLRLIHLLRHHPDEQAELEGQLDRLLPEARLFRACVEALEVEGLTRLLVRKADWLLAYSRAGASFTYPQLAPAVWEAPFCTLDPFLGATEQLGERMRREVLRDLGLKIASERVDASLLEVVRKRHMLPTFYDVATRELPDTSLCRLAERLAELSYYRGELHEAVCRGVLRELIHGPESRPTQLQRWLREQVQECPGDPYLRAVSDLAVWVQTRGEFPFRLRSHPVTQVEYLELLRAAWAAAPARVPVPDLVEVTYRRESSREFLHHVSSQLLSRDLDYSERLLAGCARCCAREAGESEALRQAIETSADPARLARHFIAQLQRAGTADPVTVDVFARIEQRHKRRLWKR